MIPHPHSLQIVSWNANGVLNKQQEIPFFLQDYQVDVLLLQETFLRPCHSWKIPNYSIYRNDRENGAGGGTAIIIRNSLPHHLPTPAPILQTTETTTIQVPIASNLSLQLTSAYIPPKQPFSRRDFAILTSSQMPSFIAGDLNSKHTAWGCRTSNFKGITLLNYSTNADIQIHSPSSPTHFGFYQPDILDIAISRHLPQPPQITVLQALSSDHLPVLFSLSCSPLRTSPPPVTRINWSAFPNHLQLGPLPTLRTPADVDKETCQLTSEISQALSSCTTSHPHSPYSPQLPPEIRDLIRSKNRWRKRAQRTRHPDDRRTANRLVEEVREKIRDFKNESWDKFTASLPEGHPRNLWRVTKRLRLQPSPSIHPLHGARGLVYSDKAKANTFAHAMELQFSPNEHLGDDETERTVSELSLSDAPSTPIDFISPSEIHSLLKLLNTNTAPGPDLIPNRALKLLPPRGIARLTNLFNAILRTHHYPSSWKTSTIIMIPKPNKSPTFPDNHRPISLLSCISKLLERLLLRRLLDHASDLLPPQQFGFRHNHSSELQVLRLVEFIQEGFQHKDHSGCIFLDISKAFDRVWHEGLLFKLVQLRTPQYLVLLLHSFLQNRSFRIKIGSTFSHLHPITAGVPQGSILSPLLYSLYTADLPDLPHAFLGTYADDTAIATSSRDPRLIHTHLQNCLNSLTDYFEKWKIDINPDKCQAVFFTRRRPHLPDNLELHNVVIPWRPQAPYLGVLLDSRLRWNPHIQSVRQKARTSLQRLYPLLGRWSGLSLRIKRRLYLSIIRPQLSYAAITWALAAPSYLKPLEAIQNKAMRIITASPWYIRNLALRRDLELPPLTDTLRTLSIKSLTLALSHSNPLLQDALNYNPTHLRTHRRHRQLIPYNPG